MSKTKIKPEIYIIFSVSSKGEFYDSIGPSLKQFLEGCASREDAEFMAFVNDDVIDRRKLRYFVITDQISSLFFECYGLPKEDQDLEVEMLKWIKKHPEDVKTYEEVVALLS